MGAGLLAVGLEVAFLGGRTGGLKAKPGAGSGWLLKTLSLYFDTHPPPQRCHRCQSTGQPKGHRKVGRWEQLQIIRAARQGEG